MEKKSRVQYYDIIRVLAIGLVILGHCLGKWMLWDQPMDKTRTVIHVIYCFCPMCIGIFFMISGALLLKDKKNQSVRFVFTKRVPRVLVPALFWSVIYLIFYSAERFTQPISGTFIKRVFIPNAVNTVKNSLNTPWSSHLWFVYAMLAFYILLPILCTIIQNATKKQLEYILAVWFVAGCIVPLIGDFFPSIAMPNRGNINILSGYAGIFILGYYLDTYVKKISLPVCAGLFAAVMVFTVVFATKYINSGRGFPPVHHYYSPTVLAASGCVVLAVKELNTRKPLSEKTYSVITKLSAATFGTYFCHELVRILLQNRLISMGLSPYAVIAINFTATLIISFAAAYIALKIPYINYLFCGVKIIKK
ncbi:MAG: acyltransferase family protein [Clostridia bacterium]|nr:acyltransferase family protein [Clostridia bacterium]